MCIVGIAYNKHPNFQIALLANRDEWRSRKSKAAHHWNDPHQIIAGIDLNSGGTWLGINKTGRWCALCNDPRRANQKDTPSRGLITKSFLSCKKKPEVFINQLQDIYLGFFMLFGDYNSAFYHSNVDNQTLKLNNGFYTISNTAMKTSWPKTERLQEKLKKWVDYDCQINMGWKTLGPDGKTESIDINNQKKWDQYKRENIFIKGKYYGTTHSSIILINEESSKLLQKAY